MFFCDDLPDIYNVYPYTESVESLQEREDLTVNHDPLYCPAQDVHCGGILWSVQYKLTVEQSFCPSRFEAIGTALAYSAYAEVLFTVLIVGISFACGRFGLIQPKEKKTSVMSTVEL